MTIRPRFLDGARKRRPLQKTLAILDHVFELRIDPVRPLCIEEKRRAAAIRETEALACRPLAVSHRVVEPRIRDIELGARIGDTARIAFALVAQAVEDDLLL